MNNKGMTLVELLVTFSLLMIIVIGMFNLILDTKLDLDNKQIARDYIEYSNFINSDIHGKLINRKVLAAAYKNTSDGNWKCSYSESYVSLAESSRCKINGNVFSAELDQVSAVDGVILPVKGSVDLNSICGNIYPCAVYAYFVGNNNIQEDSNGNKYVAAEFEVIAINAPKTRTSTNKYAIKYGSKKRAMLEEVPKQSYLDNRMSYSSVNIDTSNNFIINVPIYMTGDDKNYGFKIVYPLYAIDKTKNSLGEEIK